MGASSSWYRDERELLDEFRDGNAVGGPAPSLPGYADWRRLRQGGQGVVYSATQLSTKRRVAIKVLPHGSWNSSRQRQRFEREIDLLAAVRHPNVVQLYDGGVTDQGQPYYVMEYVAGVSLDEHLRGPGRIWGENEAGDRALLDARQDTEKSRERPERSGAGWSIRSVLELFAQVCEAVGAAHQCGMIHRDLKPSNILIDEDGKPHVLDFGLGKNLDGGNVGSSALAMSMTGEFMGSLPWASPEQIEGVPNRMTARTDVYSLGVLLFQFLTGQFPYDVHGGFGEVVDQIRAVEPLKPSALYNEIDDEINTIVLKCLAKEPDRRYPDAANLARELRRYLAGEPIEAKADSALYRLRKRLRRNWAATGLVLAFVALGALGIRELLTRRGSVLTPTSPVQPAREVLPADPLELVTDSIGQTKYGKTYFVNELAGLPDTVSFPASVAIGQGGAVVAHTVGPNQMLESGGTICIGYDSDATLKVSAGGRVEAHDCSIADQDASKASLTLAGEGSSLSVVITTWVGRYGGDGRLEILDGAEASDTAARIGMGPGSTGVVLVDGSGARWTHGGELDIGYEGNGELHITRGGLVSSVYGHVARRENSTGFVTITGTQSTWSNLGSVYVGGEPRVPGGHAELHLESGGLAVVHHKLEIWPESAVYVRGGTLRVDTVDVDAGGRFELADGSIHVNTFRGDLLNEGAILGLAHSPGTINVSGNFEQDSGALELRLHGPAPEQHDRLSVSGTVALGGELHLIRSGGYEPDSDDRLVVLSAEHVAGTFAAPYGRIALLGGGSCEILYAGQEVILTHFEGPSPSDPAFTDPFPDGPLPRPNLPHGRFPRHLSRNTTGEHDLIFLGPPDDNAMTIAGGIVEYDFGDLRVVNGEGPDFNVYESDVGTPEIAKYDVLVSEDGVAFTSVKASWSAMVRIPGAEAHGGGSYAQSLDLEYAGLSYARYIRLEGIGDEPDSSSGGFDLDAIGAIHIAAADELATTLDAERP